MSDEAVTDGGASPRARVRPDQRSETRKPHRVLGELEMQPHPDLNEIAKLDAIATLVDLVDFAVERHGSLEHVPSLTAASLLMNAAIERVEERIAAGHEILLDLSNETHRAAMAEALAVLITCLFDGVREVPPHETLVSAALAEMGAS